MRRQAAQKIKYSNQCLVNGADVLGNILCAKCHKLKFADLYYRRTAARRDSVCIDCRRKERNDRYKKEIKSGRRSQNTPKRIIEPKKTASPRYESRIHETNQIAIKSDFTDMELNYGKMEHNERYEIVQRFNEFTALLRDGYSELVGCDVYVRKD